MADETVSDWVERSNKLDKLFIFADFERAWKFMTLVAEECSKMDHHPDWRNVYNKVWVSLSTHSAGGKVTKKDRLLARRMDFIYQQLVS